MVCRLLCWVLLISWNIPGMAQERFVASSAPYLSGDTFRSMCDFHFDEITTSFAPKDVKKGDCIFVKTDMLDSFFQQKHPLIKNPYVLVSHNSDLPAPGPGLRFLKDPKILAWYAQNVAIAHSKLHPIPIGLANKMWKHGDVPILDECLKRREAVSRDKILYMNFAVNTCVGERKKAFDFFAGKKYCFASTVKPWREYLLDLLAFRFVLSPRGNGLDCHRTWEALYMGAIPIVKESPMDALFERLPVLIVKNWDEVTEEFLQKKYDEIRLQTYAYEKLYAEYWRAVLSSYKKERIFKKEMPKVGSSKRRKAVL